MMTNDWDWNHMVGDISDIEKLADAIHNEYVNRSDVIVEDVEHILRNYRSQHIAKAIAAGIDDFSSGVMLPLTFKEKLIRMILSRLETGERLDGAE